MRTAHKGFTLAELLIALALLGIIAAFTIPKVIQATGTQEATAKVRETVSTIEQGFYNRKMQNQLIYQPAGQATLYHQLAPNLNAADAQAGAVPANVLAAGHPCQALAPNGWVQFQNGVVVTGLADGPDLDSLPWDDASHDETMNYVICIDYNGNTSPNAFGQDVFIGNFNQYGKFSAATVNSENSKSFNWGSANTAVFDNTGATVGGAGGPGDPARQPAAYAGAMLVRN